MRTLSASAIRAILHSETSAMFPLLIAISHSSLVSPIRIVNNNADMTYGGNVYTAFPFRFDPPDETDDGMTNARLTVCNVDRTMVETIRALPGRPTVSVIASFYYEEGTPVFEAVAAWEFVLSNVSYDKSIVSGELIYEDRLSVNVPVHHMTAFLFPGVAGMAK